MLIHRITTGEHSDNKQPMLTIESFYDADCNDLLISAYTPENQKYPIDMGLEELTEYVEFLNNVLTKMNNYKPE